MLKTTFKSALLFALACGLLSGCVHVRKEERVVEPAPVTVAPPPR
jgi:hypothetical protein